MPACGSDDLPRSQHLLYRLALGGADHAEATLLAAPVHASTDAHQLPPGDQATKLIVDGRRRPLEILDLPQALARAQHTIAHLLRDTALAVKNMAHTMIVTRYEKSSRVLGWLDAGTRRSGAPPALPNESGGSPPPLSR